MFSVAAIRLILGNRFRAKSSFLRIYLFQRYNASPSLTRAVIIEQSESCTELSFRSERTNEAKSAIDKNRNLQVTQCRQPGLMIFGPCAGKQHAFTFRFSNSFFPGSIGSSPKGGHLISSGLSKAINGLEGKSGVDEAGAMEVATATHSKTACRNRIIHQNMMGNGKRNWNKT